MVPLATDIITGSLTGRPSPVPELKERKIPYYGVKEAVFPFNMFPEVDPILGPEMRSTGEVLGLAETVGEAYFKAQEGAKAVLPLQGTVLLSISDGDKEEAVPVGTAKLIEAAGIPVERVNKIYEGQPNIEDWIINGKIQLIVNTPAGKTAAHDDSYLRKGAIKHRVTYITTMVAAKAAAEGINQMNKHGNSEVLLTLPPWWRPRLLRKASTR